MLSIQPHTKVADDLNRRLTAIPELDIDLGLRCLRGNLSTYARLLRKYATTHNDDLRYLRQRLAANDVTEARLIAHSLKGASATMGAVVVQACAAELDTALQAGRALAELEPLIEAVETAHTALSTAILQALPEKEEPPVEVDWVQIRVMVSHLEMLLAENDLRASQMFAESVSSLRAAFGDDVRRIEQCIDVFDYDRALNLLHAMLAEQSERLDKAKTYLR